MADVSFSSLMDWQPQTPPPAFNPYPGNYMPGGWPAEPPTPPFRDTGLFAIPRRRSRLEELVVPIAKRVCTGLAKATVAIATTVVAVPAYLIVRQVRRHQAARIRAYRRRVIRRSQLHGSPFDRAVQAGQPPRVRRVRFDLPPTPQTIERPPPQAQQTSEDQQVEVVRRSEEQTSVELASLPKQQDKQESKPLHKPQGLYEVPEFRPDYILNPIRRHAALRRYLRGSLRGRDAFCGMPRFSPKGPRLVTLPTPEQKIYKPIPEADSLKLCSPYPQLIPNSAQLPSAGPSSSSEEHPTPSTQLQTNLLAVTPIIQTTTRTDSEEATRVVSSVTSSRKRRIHFEDAGSAQDDGTPTAKRTRSHGPSAIPAEMSTPRPSITVQIALSASAEDTESTPVNNSLLTPSRFRSRRVATPATLTTPRARSPNTPLSAISSTCDVSPGNYQVDTARSPAKSEISSAFAGSPHLESLIAADSSTVNDPSSFFAGTPPSNPQQEIGVLRMIAGGGSSTPTPKPSSSRGNADVARSLAEDAEVLVPSPVLASKNSATEEVNHQANNKLSSPTTEVSTDVPEEHHGPAKQRAASETANTSHSTEDNSSSEAAENLYEQLFSDTAEQQPTPALSPSVNVCEDSNAHDSASTVLEQQPNPYLSPIELTDDEEPGASHSSPTKEQATPGFSPHTDLRDHDQTGEPSSSAPSPSPSTESSRAHTPEKQLAHLRLDEDKYTPEKPTPKATHHSAERTTRKTRATARREALKKDKRENYELVDLTTEQEEIVKEALRIGLPGEIKAVDFQRVVPSATGYSGGTQQWLNDEVINAYLNIVVKHGNQNDRPDQVPTYHAFSSFFWVNLNDPKKGYNSVQRWARRAKINGPRLLETQAVFIPVNPGNTHWTLLVVSGKTRTVTHYDSLGGSGARYIAKIKEYLAAELGSNFVEGAWSFVDRGDSPRQSNMDDCGVFAITSARQLMLGLTPMSYGPEVIPLQRRRIVAEVVAGALLKSGL
jgi:hypothetical protein